MSLVLLNFTLCNIYLPPSLPVFKADLMNLVMLLSPLEHILWGSDHIDDRGTIVADTSAEVNLTLLNRRANIHLCLGFGTSCAPYLAYWE
jgi:hypothetical protein